MRSGICGNRCRHPRESHQDQRNSEAKPADVGAVVDGGVAKCCETWELLGPNGVAHDGALMAFEPLPGAKCRRRSLSEAFTRRGWRTDAVVPAAGGVVVAGGWALRIAAWSPSAKRPQAARGRGGGSNWTASAFSTVTRLAPVKTTSTNQRVPLATISCLPVVALT